MPMGTELLVLKFKPMKKIFLTSAVIVLTVFACYIGRMYAVLLRVSDVPDTLKHLNETKSAMLKEVDAEIARYNKCKSEMKSLESNSERGGEKTKGSPP
jgi:hypothetical protein